MIRYILYITSTVLLFYFCVTNLSIISISKRKKLLLILMLYSLHFIFVPRLSQSYLPIILSCIIIFICFESTNRLLDVICFLLGYIFNVALNSILLSLYGGYIDHGIYEAQYPLLFPFAFLCVSYICTYFAGKLIREKVKKTDRFWPKNLVLPMLVNICICVILCVFNIVQGDRIGYGMKEIFFNMILFLVYLCVTSFLLFRIYKAACAQEQDRFLSEQYRILSSYAAELEKSYETLRAVKHDYNNILLSISNYLEYGKVDELKAYCKNEVFPFFGQAAYDTGFVSQLIKLQVLELKSLFTAKLFEATGKGLNVHLEIEKMFNTFSIPPLALVRILGIFLDISFNADGNFLEFSNMEKCQVSFRKVNAVKEALLLYS